MTPRETVTGLSVLSKQVEVETGHLFSPLSQHLLVVRGLKTRRRRLVALFAVQDHAKVSRAAFGGRHPGAAEKGRMVSHMLPVAAGQIGDPMAFFVLMIADDGLVHAVPLSV